MKQSYQILFGAVALMGMALAGSIIATPAFAQEREHAAVRSGTMTAPVAKISPVQAMKAAEAKVGGKAAVAIFEFDEGHWIYGVVVAKNRKLMEVDVNPITGVAGSSESVTPEDEAKEFQAALTKLIQ